MVSSFSRKGTRCARILPVSFESVNLLLDKSYDFHEFALIIQLCVNTGSRKKDTISITGKKKSK